MASIEKQRLEQDRLGQKPWRRWGPYLSERQWGTVREDYSADGDAWNFVSHDHARSRAYRWGEDGLGGFCDERQTLCLAVALWNGRDPILKERLFGLTNAEGNHGEDVKELYYYLDATPTYSYSRMLYKYPQAAYPYAQLIEANRLRSQREPEFELWDTGVFDEHRYFDVNVEYAKASADDLLWQLTVCNRGPERADVQVLPQIWFRNTWGWSTGTPKPSLRAVGETQISAVHPELGEYAIDFDGAPELLFCDNETNGPRLFGTRTGTGFYKDGFHQFLVHKDVTAINSAKCGTKSCGLYRLSLEAGATHSIRIRLSPAPGDASPLANFDGVLRQRIEEADAFFGELQPMVESEDLRRIHRQAIAGMLWSKQFFRYDVPQWLDGDPGQPPLVVSRRHGRNSEWRHLNNADVISIPDKWEYPWYAAWDLAFHCVSLALVDPEFAKSQLIMLCREWYMHPNGQLPAYEWNFGDVNPPVHAWAAWKVYQIDRQQGSGVGDLEFLERVFHKLMLNFTWWVNRKDREGRNIFQGGFLGLDNIGVFDRSAPLPTGGYISQADGTAWMAMYCLNLTRIALELAQDDHVYEDIATKFFEHFLHIAEAMNNIGDEGIGLWDDEDEFYYDVLSMPCTRKIPLRLHSMVGLIPLFAVEVIDQALLDRVPAFQRRLEWFLNYRPDLAKLVSRWQEQGENGRHLLALVRASRLQKILTRMLDETEFLSSFGVRALSRHHAEHPYAFEYHGVRHEVSYAPGESDSRMFGGNSNWRGPVWMPVNYLLIESLRQFHHFYGDSFTVECPTGSGRLMSLNDVADELSRRLCALFSRGGDQTRPCFGSHPLFQLGPEFRDHLLFHEYFHGDTGRGCGASHQTGWTGLVANLIHELHHGAH